jgi:hypothetical protein
MASAQLHHRSIEPLTFRIPCMPVSSDGVVLGLVAADQGGFDGWRRLSGSGGIWARWYLAWSWFAGPVDDGGPAIAIRIMHRPVTVETGNRVVAAAPAGE